MTFPIIIVSILTSLFYLYLAFFGDDDQTNMAFTWLAISVILTGNHLK